MTAAYRQRRRTGESTSDRLSGQTLRPCSRPGCPPALTSGSVSSSDSARRQPPPVAMFSCDARVTRSFAGILRLRNGWSTTVWPSTLRESRRRLWHKPHRYVQRVAGWAAHDAILNGALSPFIGSQHDRLSLLTRQVLRLPGYPHRSGRAHSTLRIREIVRNDRRRR